MEPAAPLFTIADGLAVAWFLVAWVAQSWLAEHSPWAPRSLNHAMNRQRAAWIRRMAERDLRMIDTSIMMGLQNGTAFFASTSLLAIGGAFALLNSSDRVQQLFRHLPFGLGFDQVAYELKLIGLVAIYAYAFFKFGWAYRLFNYASILIGAVPGKAEVGTAEMERGVARATELTILAGRHFNRGLRAFFMSMGYLGWFLGPIALIASATLVLVVLLRRQFFSESRKAVAE